MSPEPPDGKPVDATAIDNPTEVPTAVRSRFVEGVDTAAYRARLLREVLAESPDCVTAYRIISDRIAQLSDPEERFHASEHEIRYLTTYSITPPGPGTIVDIAGSDIYAAPLKELKNWTIRSIPVLAFDYETESLPFDDESVDGVLICEVVEHFTLDPLHCLIEVNRILKVGGFVILTTPNAASWFSVHRALNYENPSRWPVYTLNSSNRKNHIHAREYVPSEVGLLLAAAGFDNTAIFTRDYAVNAPHRPIEGFGAENRGEGIFARAYKAGPPRKRSLKPLYLDDVDFVPTPKPR